MLKKITAGRGVISYSLQGKGPVLVFLHGFLENRTIWDKFSEVLSANYTVLCIDLPGFGGSDVFDTSHSMRFMAEKVHEVLLEEQISSCLLIGHSMGGYVSLAFARYFSRRLKGLVLFHSQAAADTPEAKKNRDRTIHIVQNNHGAFIASFIPSLFAEENVARYQVEIEQLKQMALRTPAQGIAAALRGMRDREDHRETLKLLDAPVFFIAGKKDARIPPEVILPQLQLAKNCEALIMDDVGHMGFIEAEEKTLLAIEHFSERVLL